MTVNQIPKQATKAPSGAAVSSMPLHVADVPLENAIVANRIACYALREARCCVDSTRYLREIGDKDKARFYLIKTAEFRRIYQAFIRAVDVMGGL